MKKLAGLAGVTVRTLHVYDESGLLKPLHRTPAGYRVYGEKELLRLQQILFFKELDFSLQEIRNILDAPDFDIVNALENHKTALKLKQDRINTLLSTIEKTIIYLKEKKMLNHEELYKGLPKERAEAYRKEAREKWGSENVSHSETALSNMGKEGFKKLLTENTEVNKSLYLLIKEDVKSPVVQGLVAKHYQIIRKLWGKDKSEDPQAEAYAGLGQLYVDDHRFSLIDGEHDPEYALFLSKAMKHFAETKLGLPVNLE